MAVTRGVESFLVAMIIDGAAFVGQPPLHRPTAQLPAFRNDDMLMMMMYEERLY